MSETIANLANKNARNALQRIEGTEQRLGAIEALIPQLITSINGAINNVQMQFSGLTEIVDALVEIVGIEAVEKKVVDARRERRLAQVAAEKEKLDQWLLDGDLIPSELVTDKSLVVFRESNPSGKTVDPDRVQLGYGQLQPDFRDELLGKGVGAKITSKDGNIYEVTEVYEFQPKKVSEPAEAVAEEVAPEVTAEAK